jgi:hypothetical protein
MTCGGGYHPAQWDRVEVLSCSHRGGDVFQGMQGAVCRMRGLVSMVQSTISAKDWGVKGTGEHARPNLLC